MDRVRRRPHRPPSLVVSLAKEAWVSVVTPFDAPISPDRIGWDGSHIDPDPHHHICLKGKTLLVSTN
jgi:hypothetical protein